MEKFLPQGLARQKGEGVVAWPMEAAPMFAMSLSIGMCYFQILMDYIYIYR